MSAFLIILIGIPIFIIVVGISLSTPRYKGPVTDHFDGKKFHNQDGYEAKGMKEVLQWMMTRKRAPWKENTSAQYGKRPLDFFKDGIRITFVNHTTFLIQVDGVNILTDPVWSTRVSPFSWAGPKRMRKPGIRFEDLPKIHVVLLSHNHYDHLDLQTMRMVFGAHHPKIITPLGVKAYLEKEKLTGITDLDWWNEVRITDSITVQSLPAQHFSGRGLLDRDTTLWCGFLIKSSFGNIYFAGDTGYHPQLFKHIGEKIQPVKLSILPIGAYKPAWFMSPIHTSPEDAVKIHLDVKSMNSIASHFGTFPLADDGMNDAANDLRRALSTFGIDEQKFKTLKEGEYEVYQ